MKNSEFASGESYDFRRDFRAFAEPGLLRFLAVGDEGEEIIDAEQRFDDVRRYLPGVRDALTAAQNSGEPWSAERAAEVASQFEAAMTGVMRYVAGVIAEEAAEAASPEGVKRAAEEAAFYAAEAETERRAIERYAAVDAEAELETLRRIAADPSYLRPFGGGDGYARAMMSDHLHLYSTALQDQWGDEATATFLPIAAAARGGKDDPAMDLRIDQMAYAFVRKFMDAKIAAAAAERRPRDNPEPAPKADEQKAARPRQREPMFKRIGLLKAKPREWLIRGFLPRNEACNPFGRPDSFKGVTAAQLCVHIAGGVPFLGMDVKQAPTAYFAAERAEQVKRRIKGHIQRLGLPDDLPCYFGDRPVNLLNGEDVQLMFEEIKAMERDAGAPIGFLVVDTQSRTQDGDENSTKDGAKYAAAVEQLRSHTSITPWIIAHIGHAETAQDRPRGSSSLLGAYDVFYKFKKVDETHGSIRITIDRDGLGQKEFAFVVDLFATGMKNEDGEPVVVPYVEPGKADPPKVGAISGLGFTVDPVEPTATEREALRALRQAIKECGVPGPDEEAAEQIPAGVVTVTRDEWADAFRKFDRERKDGASRQAFSRGSGGLVAKGLVGAYGDWRWQMTGE